MADISLAEWDGVCEIIEIDLRRWGLDILRFCNSAKGWSTNDDGVEEPTDELDMEFVDWNDDIVRVLPFKTQGWRKGGDGMGLRPSITIGDVGGLILRQLRSINGAKMAPITHFYVLSSDLEANTGEIVASPHRYMVNRVQGNGMQTTIELGTYADTTRTPFPVSKHHERDFPGMRNRYNRS